MKTVTLGIDTREFHEDLEQIENNVKSLIQLGVIQRGDIDLIKKRIWGIIPKYITASAY